MPRQVGENEYQMERETESGKLRVTRWLREGVDGWMDVGFGQMTLVRLMIRVYTMLQGMFRAAVGCEEMSWYCTQVESALRIVVCKYSTHV